MAPILIVDFYLTNEIETCYTAWSDKRSLLYRSEKQAKLQEIQICQKTSNFF